MIPGIELYVTIAAEYAGVLDCVIPGIKLYITIAAEYAEVVLRQTEELKKKED